MTLATPTTEPATQARHALAAVEGLPIPAALTLINEVRSMCSAAETRVLARQIDAGIGSHQIRQIIKDSTGSSNRDAAQTVRRAEALHQLPDLVGQMETGELSTGQADLVAQAVSNTSADTVTSDPGFVDRLKEATVDEGTRIMKDWVIEQQDPDGLRNRHEQMKARREASFFTDSSGMVGFRGLFPPLVGLDLKAAVTKESRRLYEAEGGRDLSDDQHPTSQVQRTADAMANLLLGRGKKGSSPGRPAIIVTVNADRLAGLADAPPAVLLGSGPLPDESVNDLAERADILGLVFGGDGQPLWLGRKKRLASDAQFIAAMVRDRGCVRCGETHNEMVAHHTIAFSATAQGKTDIDNLAMLGSGCHTDVHANQQRLMWDPGEKAWRTRKARPEEQARPRNTS